MKRIPFAAIAVICCICFSCNPDVGVNEADTAEQKNIAAFEAINTMFETGDVSGLDSLVAEDFVDHSDHGVVKGIDSLKAMIVMMANMENDWKNEVINVSASDDYVYGLMRYTGTSDGSMGMPAGPFDMKAIELVRYNDAGKMVEHWAFVQPSDMMKMMGQSGMGNAEMDSTASMPSDE